MASAPSWAADLESDWGFTGHLVHAPSGLHLAMYRAYDAGMGRWLNRDPLEDAELLPEGPNLYACVGNDPLNWIDPTGNAEDKFVPDASKHGGRTSIDTKVIRV